MTPSIVSLFPDMKRLAATLQSGESASTQAESVASTVKSEAGKFQHWATLFRFSRNLNQLSDVVLKTHQRWISHGSLSNQDQEIEDIIVLKNNKGTEDNRVRKLDYSIQLSKIFIVVSSRMEKKLVLTA